MPIDTHAHLNFAAYKDDVSEVAKRALAENVWFINVGSQLPSSRRALEFAQKYNEGVFAAVGLHPIHLIKQEVSAPIDEDELIEFETDAEKFDYEAYKALAQNEKVVAIGETGLDHYHLTNSKKPITNATKLMANNIDAQKALQKEIFIKHLELAQELNKPLIIHCREAHKEVIEILKNSYNNSPQPSLNIREGDVSMNVSAPPLNLRGGRGELKGVVHSFSGRWSQAQEYLQMGFYLGFNGIITFARDYDRVVKEAPLERLLIETDCPYLTPLPFRGKRNEPSYVKYVAQKIAELRGISYDEVAEMTTRNARELFGI